MANTSFNNNPFQALGLQNASDELGNTKATSVNKNKSPLFYKPYGACGTVTGSTHFIYHTQSDKYFAVDCGLLQGEGEEVENEVSKLPVHPKDLHAIFLTHAHADHIGNLLQWMRAGFRGQIYCTKITSKLTELSLADILSHMNSEDVEELDKMLKLLPTLFVCPDTDSDADYGQLYLVQGVQGLRYSFMPTAHLIGCVSVRLFCSDEGQTQTDIVFSADVGAVSNAESTAASHQHVCTRNLAQA
jgi:metallo-beta-lactamase family protein